MDILVKPIDLMVFLHRVDPIVKEESQTVRLNLFILTKLRIGIFKEKNLHYTLNR
jgi:hypothetical protein